MELGQILICQNQKLQVPIFMVYKAPDVELIRIKYDDSVMEIKKKMPWQPF